MSKIAAVLMVIGLVGCGGDDSAGTADAGLQDPDAAAPVDASAPDALVCDPVTAPVACDPLAPSACGNCQKCAAVEVAEGEFESLCVEDGTVAATGMCTEGEVGPSGFDDCQAGLDCVAGFCQPICKQEGTWQGSCEPGRICADQRGSFDDVPDSVVGFCATGCDPVAGISRADDELTIGSAGQCAPGDVCRLASVFGGYPSCGAPDLVDRPKHLESCSSGACICAAGHAGPVPGGDLTSWRSNHVFFANTIDGVADVCYQLCDTRKSAINGGPAAEFQADCPTGSECRFATGVVLNFNQPNRLPDNLGMCIPVADFESCADHTLGDIGAYIVPLNENPAAAGVPADNNYIPGCSSGPVTIQKATFCDGDGPDVPAATYANSACAPPAID